METLIAEILGKKLNLNQIETTFQKLDLEVPQEMINYYLLNNNQTYFQKYFVLEKDNALKEIFKVRGWFCIVFEDEINLLNLSFEQNYKHSREFLPDYLIPFAYNDMADYYAFSNRVDDHGSIYFIRNDMFYEELGAINLLSESLEKFVNKLITEEELIKIDID